MRAALVAAFLSLTCAAQCPLPSPRLPQKLKIVGKEWRVVVVDHLFDDFIGWTVDNPAAIKELPADLQPNVTVDEIMLARNQSYDSMRDTLIHEIEHAIIGTHKSFDKVTVHEFIRLAASGWAQVLRENPELVSYLGVR